MQRKNLEIRDTLEPKGQTEMAFSQRNNLFKDSFYARLTCQLPKSRLKSLVNCLFDLKWFGFEVEGPKATKWHFVAGIEDHIIL